MSKEFEDFIKAQVAAPVMHTVTIDNEGYPVNSPFSFLGQLREAMPEITHHRALHKDGFVVPPFDPFHDRLTSLVLRDGGVRNTVYKLVFDELATSKKEWIGVMQRYIAGPLFNAFVFPARWHIPTNRIPQCFVGRRLRDIAPMPNFGHFKGMDVKVMDGPKHDVVIFNQSTFNRLAVTVEGRRRQKLLEGITHTADGRPIDDNGRVPEDDSNPFTTWGK